MARASLNGNVTPLLTAVCWSNLPAMKMILSVNVTDIDQRDEWQLSRSFQINDYGYRPEFYPKDIAEAPGYNATPLHRACTAGNWEIIEELLNRGANWKLKDVNGKVPRDFLHSELDSDVIKQYDVLCDKIEKERSEAERKDREEKERLEREKLELERSELERKQNAKREQTRTQAEDDSGGSGDSEESDNQINDMNPNLLLKRNKFRRESMLFQLGHY